MQYFCPRCGQTVTDVVAFGLQRFCSACFAGFVVVHVPPAEPVAIPPTTPSRGDPSKSARKVED